MKGKIIIVSGPSGIGKDTVVSEYLKRNDAYKSVSCTSREMREGDIPDRTYHFITKEEFEDGIKNGKFLEYTVYNNNYYGTLKNTIDEKIDNGIDVVMIIEVEGQANIKRMYPECISIFLLPPSMEVLRERLVNRGNVSIENIEDRLETAKREIDASINYDYRIVNDDLNKTVEEIEKIVQKEKTE
jgi:guanylate kinase